MGSEPATPPANSRFFLLALGLLVGFVIGFIVLLANLPVDQSTVDFRTRAVTAEPGSVQPTHFEFYTVLAGGDDSAGPGPDQTDSAANLAGGQAAGQAAAQASTQPRNPASGPSTLELASSRVGESVPSPNGPAAPSARPAFKPATRSVPGSALNTNGQNLAAHSYSQVPTESIGNESFYLQAGSFRDAQAAERMRAAVLLLGLEAFIVTREETSGALGHRVRIGPFYDQQRLTEAKKRLRRGELAYEIIRVTG